MANPGDDNPPKHLFGEIAVELSFISSEQLDEALQKQAGMRAHGSKSRLGEVLKFSNLFDDEKIKKVMSEQRKRRQADAEQQLPRERFGDYKLLARLGSGGMGEVFKARDVFTEEIVALKVLGKMKWREKDTVERFDRELNVADAMEHPNIVKTLAVGKLSGVS